MSGETPEIINQIFKILTIALSAVGVLSCIYILSGFISKNKGNLYIKGNAYLVLDVDEIGDKLEYYVRKIEDDIAGRYIYISKIILYSKSSEESCEIFEICKILSETYNNIIFLNSATVEGVTKSENDIFVLMSKSVSAKNNTGRSVN